MAVLSELCAVKKQERDKLQEKYREIEFKLSRAEVLMKSLREEQVRTCLPPYVVTTCKVPLVMS